MRRACRSKRGAMMSGEEPRTKSRIPVLLTAALFFLLLSSIPYGLAYRHFVTPWSFSPGGFSRSDFFMYPRYKVHPWIEKESYWFFWPAYAADTKLRREYWRPAGLASPGHDPQRSPPPPMKPLTGSHEFTLVLSGATEVSSEIETALVASGCGDAKLSCRSGVLHLSFRRVGMTRDEAVKSAVRNVIESGAGLGVVRVEGGHSE